MIELTCVARRDVKKGKLLWFRSEADLGESWVEGPVVVQSVEDDVVVLSLLGPCDTITGHGKRMETLKIEFKIVSRCLFIPQTDQLKSHFAKERAWISAQQKFLDDYRQTLQEAYPT